MSTAIQPSRIRFDDAIVVSEQFAGKEVQKFTKNVNWCRNLPDSILLTPAILCQDTETVPGGIECLREMIEEGLVYPDLHGWDHGPYNIRTQEEVEEHLCRAHEWFDTHLGVPPVRWVTPHGSNSLEMEAAARRYGLVIETTAHPVVDQKNVDTQIRESHSLEPLRDIVILNHWWDRGLRLYRIAKIIQYQSIEAAMEATREELSVRDQRVCWDTWRRND